MSVKDADISFVLQGPFQSEVLESVAAIRALFPESEVVLSTYEGTDTSAVQVDRIVLTPDPGPTVWQYAKNFNRLLVTTRNGLLTASRPYCVKLRTDCVLTGRGFAEMNLARFPRSRHLAILEQRVLCPTKFVRHPSRRPLLFHPSDMFHFGLRGDLLRLWNVPHAESFKVDGRFRSTSDFSLVPEQMMFRGALEAAGFPRLPYQLNAANAEWLRFWSNGLMTQNFWIAEDEELGISYPERGGQPWDSVEQNFTPAEWRAISDVYANDDAFDWVVDRRRCSGRGAGV